MAEVRVGFTFDERNGKVKIRELTGELDKADKSTAKFSKTIKGDLNQGLEQMAGRLGPVGGLLKGLGPAGLAAAAGLAALTAAAGVMIAKVTEGIRGAVDLGGKLTDLRDATGLSVESLQRLGFAAQQGGSSMEAVAGAVNKFQKNLVSGTAEARQALDALGLSQSSLIQMDPEAAFIATAEAIRGLSSPTEQAAAAMQLFGRTGADLLPAIKAGLAEAAQQAEALGLVMDNETAEAMDHLGDSVDALSGTWDGFWRNVGAAIAKSPEIVQAIESITRALGALSTWVRDYGPVVIDQMKDMGQIAIAIWTRDVDLLKKGLSGMGSISFSTGGGAGGEGGFSASAAIVGDLREIKQWAAAAEEALKGVQRQSQIALGFGIQDFLGRTSASGLPVGTMPGFESIFGLGGPSSTVTAAEMASAVNREMEGAAKSIGEAARATFDWNGFLQGTALLAGAITGRFGAMINVIGNVAQAFKDAKTSGDKFNAIASGVGQLGGIIGGRAGSAISGAAGGAMTGAAIGSIVPGIGTVIGGVVGGVAGFFGGLFGGGDDEERRRQEEEERQRRAQYAQEATQQLQDLLGEYEAARRQLAEGGGLGLAALFEDAATAADTTQERLDRLSRMGGAALANLRAEGLTLLEAMEALGPTLEAAARAAAESGLELSGPLAALVDFQRKLGTEAGQAFAAGAEGLAAFVAGLQATGSLTQDMLPDIAAELGVLRERAAAAGIEGAQELSVLAPVLYQIQQAAEAGRLTIDEGTQALIDQAEAGGHFAGLIDPMERLIQIQEAMLVLWAEMAKVLGADIPDAARKAIEAIGGIPAPPGSHELPETGGIPQMAAGGYVAPRPGGQLIRVAEGGEGEFITPAGKASISINVGGITVSGGGDSVAIAAAVAEALERQTAPRLLAAVRHAAVT